MKNHLVCFEGGNALSPFRAQQLLSRLQLLEPSIKAVTARYVHWAALEQEPTADVHNRMAALLNYGPAFSGPAQGAQIVVCPRWGTVSPWASKATDIARNCGLSVRRVERVTQYFLAGLSTVPTPVIAALLYDRMTESVVHDVQAATQLFTPLQASPVVSVDVLAQGTKSLLIMMSEAGFFKMKSVTAPKD